MYTVIIQQRTPELPEGHFQDRATTQQLSRAYSRLFFQEHIDRGEVDFCAWNPEGTTVETALPNLYRLIAGKHEWRAIVVLTPSDEDRRQAQEQGLATTEQNPFDFLVNRDADPYTVTESTVPLIRLTHMLGGIPRPEMRFERVEHLGDDGVYYMTYDSHKEEHEAALREHKRLSQQYLFVDNRPKEILLLSTREPVDTTDQEVRSAWTTRLETESSEFWNRNRYPSTCRFLVFDVLNERHSLYSGCVFRLWSAVLLLAINQVENSSLQAYRLYKLSVDMDRKRLGSAFSRYVTRLVSMSVQLDMADANRESVERMVAKTAPRIDQSVEVAFTCKKEDDLLISTRHLGLTTDQPRGEKQYWAERFRAATVAVHDLVRSPLRALDVAADDTRIRGVYDPQSVEELNQYQRADLEEVLEWRYFDTLAHRRTLGVNVKKRQSERAVIDHQVRKRIAQRLDRKRALMLGGIAAGSILLGSLPYLINAARTGAGVLGWALLALVLMVAVCAGFGLVELWIQRKEMADAMEDHNRCVTQLHYEIMDSAGHYSDYLSALCAYLRGRSYLDREEQLAAGRANVAKMRSAHRKAIDKCLRQVRDWATALGAVVEPVLNDRSGESFDPAVPPEVNLAYRFELPHGGRTVPLNQTGETMESPYDFIQGITLEREELFDDVDPVEYR